MCLEGCVVLIPFGRRGCVTAPCSDFDLPHQREKFFRLDSCRLNQIRRKDSRISSIEQRMTTENSKSELRNSKGHRGRFWFRHLYDPFKLKIQNLIESFSNFGFRYSDFHSSFVVQYSIFVYLCGEFGSACNCPI